MGKIGQTMGAPVGFEYGHGGACNGRAGARLAQKLADLVASLPGVRRVCDLGCGNGHLCGLLHQRELQATGVDVSESGIDIARREHGDCAQFVVGTIQASLAGKLGAGGFDAVVSSDVIEHLYRPRDLLECAHGLLAPGGWLVLGTPYHGYLKNLAISLVGGWDRHHGVDWDGGHIKFFSVESLKSMVGQAGFRVERFVFSGRLPGLWRNMACVARKVS